MIKILQVIMWLNVVGAVLNFVMLARGKYPRERSPTSAWQDALSLAANLAWVWLIVRALP